MAKEEKRGSIRRPAGRKGAHAVYTNLTNKRRAKSDAKARQKAEFLATLPKSRVKRVFYRLHPKRFFGYWFSRRGAMMMLKLIGLGLAVMIIMVLAIFAIFRKDLALGPDELTKRVQSRTTKFYDRTGQVLLYELYKDQQLTFVQPDQISNNMKYATIAIEDKDFYKHGGFDLRGITRTVVNNIRGGGKQGASTITQQLVKNVILEDSTRSGLAGYTRKLKELILSIELERSYSKDQILNYYLNAIGYGGTAYGVESAAQRYFGKSAKDLNIEESAYIASIPQYPSMYDKNSPTFNAQATLDRQHTVINYMRDQGYITAQQAEDSKKVDILASIKPLSSDPTPKKAPHFVDDVIKNLEAKYGASNVRSGGWRVITTLDWEMQQQAEQSVAGNMGPVERQRGDNAALVAINVPTNQVLAMVGSRDYNYPSYGAHNAATADLQAGSSLKPIIYAKLFDDGKYGPGSVLTDQKKCWGSWCPNNFDRRFRGSISIRQALAESRNIPAIKAAEAVGMNTVVETAKAMGEPNIGCGSENDCSALGLSIGAGSVQLDQHTAAYAALARGGMAKPETNILKIEKSNGEVVEEWKDTPGTPIFGTPERGDEIRFLIADILTDSRSRSVTFPDQIGFNPPGVKTAVKTGTTDDAKDGWMMGFTPQLAVGVWVGRHDGTIMKSVTHQQTGPMFSDFISKASKNIMSKPQYGWTPQSWFAQPAGVKRMTVGGRSDFFQSWFNKPKETKSSLVMDKVSKKLATECTPEGAKETIEVVGAIDPANPNNTSSGTPPPGYNITANDDVHICGDPQPSATLSIANSSGRTYSFTSSATPGKAPIQSVDFIVNGQVISSQPVSGGNYSASYTFPDAGNYTVGVRVSDQLFYETTTQQQQLVP